MLDKDSLIEVAKTVFETEANELNRVKNSIGSSFSSAVLSVFNAKGKCIVTGMGKSGIIGRKIAASLSSTGTPSFFVHPGEAFHGDLGMFERDDIVLMLSNSGETDEVLKLLSFFHFQGNTIISITGDAESTLAKHSTHHLLCSVEHEACPLQLAPTSSTTAALAMGDALVVALIELRNFNPENFARFHPGGSLGRKLLTKVTDVMKRDNLPFVSSDESLKEVINKMTASKLGVAIQVKPDSSLEGIITDGDIRRAMENYEDEFFNLVANDISTKSPVFVTDDEMLSSVDSIVESTKIRNLLVLDRCRKVVGLIYI